MIKRLYLRAERHQKAAQALALKNDKYLDRYGDAVRSTKSFKRMRRQAVRLYFKAIGFGLIAFILEG